MERLRAAGIPATALPGRFSLRLGREGPPLSLDGLPIGPADEALARAAEEELMALVGAAVRGAPLPLAPRIVGAAAAVVEAVEQGAPLDALPRSVRLGPRLCVAPELRLAAGRISALPLLILGRQPVARALAGWAAAAPPPPEDDPLSLLLGPPRPGALRVDRVLRRLPAGASDGALLALIAAPPVEQGGRVVGSALVHEQPAPWSVRPLRASAPPAVAEALAAAELQADLHDYNHPRAILAMADPAGRPWSALRTIPHPGGLDRMVSVAAWPARPCVLPAADLLDVELPTGSFRVWMDELLDVFDQVCAPMPGLWPPRFAAAGAFPPALRARVVLAAVDRPRAPRG